jgi:hypothetical protein
METYTRYVKGGYALTNQPGGDCIFLKNKQCTAYKARPIQCRTFPWWVHNLRGPKEWAEAAVSCEGINHPEAPTVPASQIEEQCLSHLGSLLKNSFT